MPDYDFFTPDAGLAAIHQAAVRILADERFGAMRRILQGVAVDAEQVAFDVIRHAAAGDDVLGHPHTLREPRGGQVWQPRLAVRQGLVNGQPPDETALARAHAAAAKLLATHTVAPLPTATREMIADILQAYGRAHGG